jgi:DNA-binding transcriptional MerR regulator
VSGTTIGQWARRGYIRASRSAGDPHVYAVQDVAEAAIVATLLRRGVRRADVRRLRDALEDYGPWPLSSAPLATTVTGRVVLRENGVALDVLRGGQVLLPDVPLEDVHLRLTAATPPTARRTS